MVNDFEESNLFHKERRHFVKSQDERD